MASTWVVLVGVRGLAEHLVGNAADALAEKTERYVSATVSPILVRTQASREADQDRVQIQVID